MLQMEQSTGLGAGETGGDSIMRCKRMREAIRTSSSSQDRTFEDQLISDSLPS